MLGKMGKELLLLASTPTIGRFDSTGEAMPRVRLSNGAGPINGSAPYDLMLELFRKQIKERQRSRTYWKSAIPKNTLRVS
jgi:hypothetical protein